MLINIQSFLNSCAVSFDLPILDWIQTNLQSPLMDTIMPIITLFGEGGIFWIAWAVLLLLFPKTRKIGLGMGFALALGLIICNGIMKPMVGRMRPYDYQIEVLKLTWDQFLPAGKLLVEGLHDYSFPSGHTIACFEASIVLLKNSKKMGIPALIIAIACSFSRLYLYVHYPTDVLVSVVLGITFAFIGDWLAGKIIPKGGRKRGKYEAR